VTICAVTPAGSALLDRVAAFVAVGAALPAGAGAAAVLALCAPEEQAEKTAAARTTIRGRAKDTSVIGEGVRVRTNVQSVYALVQ
jgi:hypothetical protein